MSRIKWKVCGLRDNIVDVVALQPDYVGFIFYRKSPRFVGEDFNMPIIDDARIKKVGVFVNEPLDFVWETMLKFELDYAQLHGDESPEYCEILKDKGSKIIKAFQVDEAFDFDGVKEYEKVTDYFLFDTKTKHFGGSGETFDWQILKKYAMEKKYFLSGGLNLDNVDSLNEIDLTKIHALDVNSKFEIRPGLKEVSMLEKLKTKMLGLNKENQF
jgi:phosphoribosylanthranilate isomerase